jgi:hypothetical protein
MTKRKKPEVKAKAKLKDKVKTKPKEKNKGGRPSTYTIEMAAKICAAIATTPKSVYNLCDERDDFPVTSTVWDWIAKHQEFADEYFKAKEKQAVSIAENLYKEAEKISGTSEEVNAFNARFRFHQWHLSKLAPKRFSDKNKDEEKQNSDALDSLAATVKRLTESKKKDY